jgi:hypothetical protein
VLSIGELDHASLYFDLLKRLHNKKSIIARIHAYGNSLIARTEALHDFLVMGLP